MQLLLIDNVAAYYWLDRASQPLPACAFDPLRDGQTSLQQAHACIAAELQTLMRQHRLAVIATKQAVLSASSSAFDRCAHAAAEIVMNTRDAPHAGTYLWAVLYL